MSEDYKVDVEQYIKDAGKFLSTIYWGMAILSVVMSSLLLWAYNLEKFIDLSVCIAFCIFCLVYAVIALLSLSLVKKCCYKSAIVCSVIVCLFFPVGTVLGCFAISTLKKLRKFQKGVEVSRLTVSPEKKLKRLSIVYYILGAYAVVASILVALKLHVLFTNLDNYNGMDFTGIHYNPLIIFALVILFFGVLFVLPFGSIYTGRCLWCFRNKKFCSVWAVIVCIVYFPIGMVVLGVLTLGVFRTAGVKALFEMNKQAAEILQLRWKKRKKVLITCCIGVVLVGGFFVMKRVFRVEPELVVPKKIAHLHKDSDYLNTGNKSIFFFACNDGYHRFEIYRPDETNMYRVVSCGENTNNFFKAGMPILAYEEPGEYLGKAKCRGVMCYKFRTGFLHTIIEYYYNEDEKLIIR
jgi:hypothetical protein